MYSTFEVHLAQFLQKYFGRQEKVLGGKAKILNIDQPNPNAKQHTKLNPLRVQLDEIFSASYQGQQIVKIDQSTNALADVLWRLVQQQTVIGTLEKFMAAEKSGIEELLSEIQKSTTFEEVDHVKAKMRLQMFLMMKRFHLIFTQVNKNQQLLEEDLLEESTGNLDQNQQNTKAKRQPYLSKITIYESVFEDKRQLNANDLILDYLYSTFISTFKGIQAMLEKRHAQDDIILVKEAIAELIEALSLRKAEERFGGNMGTVATQGGPNAHLNSVAKSSAQGFEKRVHDMINHLTSLNQMNLPNLSSKNVISNEKNFLLSSKYSIVQSYRT